MRVIFAIIYCVTSFQITKIQGQNLVKNGGFEMNNNIPFVLHQIKYCEEWGRNIINSPDYYHALCDSLYGRKCTMGIPSNYSGYQHAHGGDAYAGIFLINERFESREFIQTPLLQVLQADKKYTISFYLSLAECSDFTSDRITACFSEKPSMLKFPRFRQSGEYCDNGVSMLLSMDKIDTTSWVKVEGVYEAIGGEKYLTIGVFLNDLSRRKYKKLFRNKFRNSNLPYSNAYYYIDDVVVEEMD